MKLVVYPDPVLEKVAKAIKPKDIPKKAIKDMFDVMYEHKGIGLAAPQVNLSKRIFVMDCWDIKRVFVNPEILMATGLTTTKEGCLSFPKTEVDVQRATAVQVKYLDEEEEEKIEVFVGLPAVCIQHELDHLNGITFLDYLSSLKRSIIEKRLRREQNGKN